MKLKSDFLYVFLRPSNKVLECTKSTLKKIILKKGSNGRFKTLKHVILYLRIKGWYR